MKRFPSLCSFALFVSCLLLVTSCKKAGPSSPGASHSDTGEILIGEYGSMSGDTATFGQSTHKGIMLAAEEINAAGGVLGRKVKILTEDDQGKPEEAVNAVLKLIQRDNVVAVLGEVASSRSMAAAPICQQNGIPMISPTSTNPDVTKKGDYIFRACFIDPFQGSVMAKFAFETLKGRTAAVLTDRKEDYSVGLAKFFKEKFTALGGTILADESYQGGDKEFKPQLSNIRALKPDVIFVPGYYTAAALIARQARELGMTMPLLGGDGWDSDVTLQSGGPAVDGCYFSTHYHKDDPRPEVRSFVEKFQAKYDAVPDSMAVNAYDAANLLFSAMVRAGTTNPKAVRDEIAKTTNFPGVSGKISIDADRNAQKSIVVLKIEGGKFAFSQLVEP